MLYRVVDLRRSVYEVDDLAQAVSDTAQSQLKRIFGGLTFTEVRERFPCTRASAAPPRPPPHHHHVATGAGEPGDDQLADEGESGCPRTHVTTHPRPVRGEP